MNRIRILVVDDDGPVLRSCVRALEEIPGAEIVQRKLGDQAARLLSSEEFDLLISDIRMPGVGGLDLLALARKLDPELPVVLITGFPTSEMSKGYQALGAAACLMKPFRPEELIATVQHVLGVKRPQPRLRRRK